jgi:hypothetical protein
MRSPVAQQKGDILPAPDFNQGVMVDHRVQGKDEHKGKAVNPREQGQDAPPGQHQVQRLDRPGHGEIGHLDSSSALLEHDAEGGVDVAEDYAEGLSGGYGACRRCWSACRC